MSDEDQQTVQIIVELIGGSFEGQCEIDEDYYLSDGIDDDDDRVFIMRMHSFDYDQLTSPRHWNILLNEWKHEANHLMSQSIGSKMFYRSISVTLLKIAKLNLLKFCIHSFSLK